jgi:hypothetical protein
MNLNRMLIAVVLVGVGLAGCAKKQVRPTPADSQARKFYPLQVGNWWVYQAKFLGDTRDQRIEIVRQEGGYFVDNQGAKLQIDNYGIRDEKRYLLRDPIQVGNEWSNVVSKTSTERYRILQTDVPCEVPAGRFDGCVKVEGRNRVDPNTTLVNVFTFAPNVGLASIEVSAETNGKKIPQTELKLTSYKVEAR